MQLMKKFILLDDKIKNWIETHKMKWYLILSAIGCSFTFLYCFLLGINGELKLKLIFSSLFLFPFIEVVCGGSGY